MKKIGIFLSVFVLSLVGFLSFGATPAMAADDDVCGSGSLLPPQICSLFNNAAEDPGGFVTNRVRFGLILALGGVVLVAVIFSILAAIKYISSQGNEGKVEEAKKSVANTLIGLAVLFIAFVGIILIFTIFGADPTTPSICNACLVDPESFACEAYTEDGNYRSVEDFGLGLSCDCKNTAECDGGITP